MIISHLHRFIFLKTKKTGGTSVELALSQICGPDDVITRVSRDDEAKRVGRKPQNYSIPMNYRASGWWLKRLIGFGRRAAGAEYYNHMTAAEIRRSMDASLFDSYRKVTIVRNPWDCEVSLYFWTFRNNPNAPPFDQFVKRRQSRSEVQNFDIYSIDGRVVADIVVRYERLSDDFASFMALLGVKPAPVLSRAKGGHRAGSARDYRTMYSPETRRIVECRFRREIEAFSYEF